MRRCTIQRIVEAHFTSRWPWSIEHFGGITLLNADLPPIWAWMNR